MRRAIHRMILIDKPIIFQSSLAGIYIGTILLINISKKLLISSHRRQILISILTLLQVLIWLCSKFKIASRCSPRSDSLELPHAGLPRSVLPESFNSNLFKIYIFSHLRTVPNLPKSRLLLPLSSKEPFQLLLGS